MTRAWRERVGTLLGRITDEAWSAAFAEQARAQSAPQPEWTPR